MKFESTAYRAKVYDQIETNSAYSKHENKLIDINQEGLENEISFNRKNESITLYIFKEQKDKWSSTIT